jgi:hypothetical protein
LDRVYAIKHSSLIWFQLRLQNNGYSDLTSRPCHINQLASFLT